MAHNFKDWHFYSQGNHIVPNTHVFERNPFSELYLMSKTTPYILWQGNQHQDEQQNPNIRICT